MSLSTDLDSTHSQPDVQLELRRQIRVWRELLALCGRKPGRKIVHNLRVTTLRLQAALEFSLSPVDADSSSAKSKLPKENEIKRSFVAACTAHSIHKYNQALVSLTC